MKIFTAKQIREADHHTMISEPIAGIDLMERAAAQCTEWITTHFTTARPVYIFCGMGNNGGDGLAIARMLHQQGYNVMAYIIFHAKKFSPDCETNKNRLEHLFHSPLKAIHNSDDFPEIPCDAIIIDALFGTGLSRPLNGLAQEMVVWINYHSQAVISIDLPSGLYADRSSRGETVMKAAYTLSFEFYKLAFLLPESAIYAGEVAVLPIGLHPDYIAQTSTPFHLTDSSLIRSVYKKRNAFAHKGTFGHALLIAGSFGKTGAAQLAARACLRSGVGLLTCQIPRCGYSIMQTAVPEAMCICDESETRVTSITEDITPYQCIGIGPGIGQHAETAAALEKLLSGSLLPVVLDADALNIIAKNPRLLKKIPAKSILTPHPKEMQRLFGESANDFERLFLLLEKSREYGLYIILKGHYSCVATPDGQLFFNFTGNPGMATGGSGDVLTGILTGLLAQGYTSLEACLMGMHLHGLAGDIAAQKLSEESMLASDIIENLGDAFKSL